MFSLSAWWKAKWAALGTIYSGWRETRSFWTSKKVSMGTVRTSRSSRWEAPEPRHSLSRGRKFNPSILSPCGSGDLQD